MTEEEWVECTHPGVLINYLGERASARKARLFACGYLRRVCGPFEYGDEVGCVLELGERLADGEVEDADLVRARATAQAVAERYSPHPTQKPMWLVGEALEEDAYRYFNSVGITTTSFVSPSPSSEWIEWMFAEFDTWLYLLRDIFGNPFRPIQFEQKWRTETTTSLAQRMYDDRDFSHMPILGDALEEAGCTETEVLNHCRSGAGHVRGCHVVDSVLGKE